jgi:competence protein ComEC
MMYLKRTKAVAVILLLLMISSIVGCTGQPDNITYQSGNLTSENLVIHFIDVGQADSILVEMPNKEVALIDGGNRDDAELIIGYIKNLKINKINYIIATHPHEDHIGGLPDIINTFKIGKVYMPNRKANTKIFEKLLSEINKKGLKIIKAKGGQKIIDLKDLKFSILAPNSDRYDETNEYSIVNKLVYKNTSFLFTGDAEEESEKEMISLGFNLSADLLKVGHHGGRTSTTESFLDKVNPKYAVISVGKDNDYGHPHKELIERLNGRNIKVLRTDEIGTIIVQSNGEKISFNKDINMDIEKHYKSKVQEEDSTYYIGNKRSHVYHDPTCSSLPKSENRILFKYKEEAENKGYRPHKTCVK